MTKSDITNRLNVYKTIGWDVFTMNSHYKMPQGMKGFPDHHMIHTSTGTCVYIEVKLKKDVLSKRQKEIQSNLITASIHNDKLFYFIVNGEDSLKATEKILDNISTGGI